MRKLCSIRGFWGAALIVASIAFLQFPAHAQSLTGSANPPTGLAGFNDSYVTGAGFPSGTITGATVSFATSCGGAAVATGPVIQVAVEATLRRFEFLIPAGLTTGTYYVSVSGTAGSTVFNTLNTPSCSQISVTATSTTLAACVPTSSLAIVAGAPATSNVTAFVPSGAWGYGTTGIAQVPLEGTGISSTTYTTTGLVNSCAANSVTGEVVCTENSINVDLINQTSVGSFSTITSGSNAYADFTGGDCMNCGVGINAANNTAVIAMGLIGGGAGGYYGSSSYPSGLQVLNLSNNTFNTAFPLANYVSEDISVDSGRNLILSPEEGGIYDLLKIGTGNTLTEYGNAIGNDGGNLDSAAEDCTTGIALSAVEFTGNIYITDLTQATFTAGSPGTWSAPGQFVSVLGTDICPVCDGGYAAGTSGVSTAPGSNHQAIVTGEFGGSSYAVLQLPSTSGSGTPALVDWAYVASMPNTPDGGAFSAGYDPHTVTAYTSPNNSKSYAVIADWEDGGAPTYLGIVDLACVLAQPRTASTHDVIGTASSCTRYVAVP